MSMYAKLMCRITESSLMDEELPVRYCFMMMLAIADSHGYVIGTDVAISRRMNIPTEDFKRYVKELMKPDPDSNSREEEGKRVIESDGERGYFLVNYRKYRDTRDEEQRREYMKEYMRNRRDIKGVAPVNSRKQRKHSLAHTEEDTEKETTPSQSEEGVRFSEWFRKTLPSDVNLPSAWKSNWAKSYDAMIRLDHRTKEEIHAVCVWARNNPFWKNNFLSPSKLRDRNKDGVQYFDVFKGRMNEDASPSRKQSPPHRELTPQEQEFVANNVEYLNRTNGSH